MTFKLTRSSAGREIVLRLSGRIESEQLPSLALEIENTVPPIALDLQDVTLVDREAVRFLGAREAEGVELLHCPPYIREWIARENAPVSHR